MLSRFQNALSEHVPVSFFRSGTPLGPWDRAIGKDGKPKPDSIFGMEMIEGLGTDLYLDRLLSDGDRDVALQEGRPT